MKSTKSTVITNVPSRMSKEARLESLEAVLVSLKY